MGEREADGVKGGERCRALKREQGHVFLAHKGGHVAPGKVAALAAHSLLSVYRLVENGHAEVGLAHLVDVGIHHAEVEGTVLLTVRAPLVVKVARRALNVSKEGLDQAKEVFPLRPHETPSPIVTYSASLEDA